MIHLRDSTDGHDQSQSPSDTVLPWAEAKAHQPLIAASARRLDNGDPRQGRGATAVRSNAGHRQSQRPISTVLNYRNIGGFVPSGEYTAETTLAG